MPVRLNTLSSRWDIAIPEQTKVEEYYIAPIMASTVMDSLQKLFRQTLSLMTDTRGEMSAIILNTE